MAVTLLLLRLVSFGATPNPCADCNVVLITVDALRPDHTNLYGYARETTPNLSRFFAGKGVFTSAYTPAPCTDPAVWQLHSGNFAATGPLLAEILRERGFRTAAIVSQTLFPGGGTKSLQRGFEHFDVQAADEVDHHGLSARRAEEMSDRAVAWLSARPRRFFLWLHYFDPHDPYDPPAAFRHWGVKGSRYADGDRRRHLGARSGRHWEDPERFFKPRDVAHFVALYDAEIAYTDAAIARVLEKLPPRTIVVLTSDHGELLGEDGRWDHCRGIGELETRVPLALSLPLAAFSPERLQSRVSTLDVYPTVLGVLGIRLPKHLDGRDLRAGGAREAVSLWRREIAVRDGRHKLYVTRRPTAFQPFALFDLEKDPLERRNLVRNAPEVVARLLESAKSIDTPDAAAEPLDVERLKALGYIQ